LVDQAAALALVLRKEFDIPFAFFEAATGAPVPVTDEAGASPPEIAPALADVPAFAQEGRAAVRFQANGCFRIILVIYDSGAPALVAGGELAALGRDIAEIAQEQVRVQKWVQAVSDRLRQADQLLSRHREDHGQESQAKTAWQTMLRLDHVMRRLRIHKEPVRNQKRILRSAWEVLGVETLVWAPQRPEDPPLVQGESCLSCWEWRQLATYVAQSPDLQTSGLLLCNQVAATSWGARFPHVSNLLALPVSDQGPLGWVIAINKKAAACSRVIPFRRSDAALLTPFLGLLDLHVRSSARYRDVQELLVGLARSLTAAIDAKDSYTYGHSERVARIAVELGRQLGLQEEELSDVFLAGLLHDIGKIGIRDAVLSKTDPLTPEEFEHIKQHVTIGYTILQDLRPISHLLPGVRNHHERYDGKGYPDGLKGEAIPLLARILAVADSFDAMTTNRPYRDSMPVQRVEQILTDGMGTQWDKRVVEAFQACRAKIHGIRQRGVGESLRHAIHDVLRTNESMVVPNSIDSDRPFVSQAEAPRRMRPP
jgi:HD-GYP domain-containing protein (c-di-GMP phosphodiesterase class II)